MAELQAIKRRIRSVGNTRQITKALQLVSASKLRRAQEAAVGPKAYTEAARELLQRLGGSTEATHHPLFQARPVNRGLTIVVAGERGMAGAYNSNVLKALMRHALSSGVTQSAICVGKYAASHVARLSDMDEIAAYDLEVDDVDIALAQPILDEVVDLYLKGEVDAVHIIYTHFVSSVKQEAVTVQLLPVQQMEGPVAESELEPNADVLLDFAIRRLMQAQILQAILESRASEHIARMIAMMNASDNAEEIIDDLTLAYNNARQSVITQELAEITAGAEAIS